MKHSDAPKYAVIIGAGPAGLTAAYELLTRTDVVPIVLEKSTYMGGIARTVNYKGNRIDLGPHRFFSKSDRVMDWWLQFMPIADDAGEHEITYQRSKRRVVAARVSADGATSTAASADRVMLVCHRKTRIYFLRRFFEYPITLSKDTVLKLGLWRTARIGMSYVRSALWPIKPERNLEEFFINRFGRVLYRTFFKSYTEKVWGTACHEISAEWGAQRVKGLSILKSVKHALGKIFARQKADLSQKSTETSLIERFLYPKLGPGQLWEMVAEEVLARGGQIITNSDVQKLHRDGDRITHVEVKDSITGEVTDYHGDYFFSTMPVKELVADLGAGVPENVQHVAANLIYRDFITVGLLVDRLLVTRDTPQGKKLLDDSWIYIQEPDVLAGRLQIFNNWGGAMVADPSKVWIGTEYFCYESDAIWKQSDDEVAQLCIDELEKIGILARSDVRDFTVLRMPKTYPAYFGAYDRFGEIREYLDEVKNLFLVGRNGMHKYNNQDHSMLTAMVAVDNIAAGRLDKANIWAVNTEQEYHEERSEPASEPQSPTATAGQRAP
jgi:protoporphyrinogen oxidase